MVEQATSLPFRGAIEIEIPSADADPAAVEVGPQPESSAERCSSCGEVRFLEASRFGGSLLPRNADPSREATVGIASDGDDESTVHRATSLDEQELVSDARTEAIGPEPRVWWFPSTTGAPIGAALQWLDPCSDNLDHPAAIWYVDSEVVGPGVPQQGDVFYVRLSFRQHAQSVCMNFNAFMYFDLPDGLALADNNARPIRTFRKDPPQADFVEYPGASYFEQQGSRLTLMSRGGVAAPQFRMWQGVEYAWWLPFTTTAPLPMRTMKVTLDATSGTAPRRQVALDFPVFAGDPRSQLWQYYHNQSGASLFNSYEKLGVPMDAESAVPWSHPRVPSNPVGTMQSFRRYLPRYNFWQRCTLTWSPRYGIYEIWSNFREVWLQNADRLGPARGNIDTSNHRIYRQEFAGGYIYYDTLWEETNVGGIYCWDDPKWC